MSVYSIFLFVICFYLLNSSSVSNSNNNLLCVFVTPVPCYCWRCNRYIHYSKEFKGQCHFGHDFKNKVATNQNALFCKLRNKKCNALFKTTCF